MRSLAARLGMSWTPVVDLVVMLDAILNESCRVQPRSRILSVKTQGCLMPTIFQIRRMPPLTRHSRPPASQEI